MVLFAVVNSGNTVSALDHLSGFSLKAWVIFSILSGKIGGLET